MKYCVMNGLYAPNGLVWKWFCEIMKKGANLLTFQTFYFSMQLKPSSLLLLTSPSLNMNNTTIWVLFF